MPITTGVWKLPAVAILLLIVAPCRAWTFEGDSSAPVATSGGRFFAHRLELAVPAFAQDDPRWSRQLLGPTTDTLGDEGCTLTSVVMVLNFYGINTDPSRLNRYLTTHYGYSGEGFLSFEKVCSLAPHHVRLAYEGPSSHVSLDENLLAGHPVIVQLAMGGGAMHFVVVVGKDGWDYLVRDPAANPQSAIYPLKEIAASIEQQYVYQRTD